MVKHTFTIDESKWLHGEELSPANNSMLFRSKDDKMCCLGFFALSCGVSLEQIKDIRRPDQVFNRRGLPEIFINAMNIDVDKPVQSMTGTLNVVNFNGLNTTIMDKLMTTNDKAGYTLEKREELIKDLFLVQDIEVNFVKGLDGPTTD